MQNNEDPLVSIVIPCYNHEEFVQACIQSIIGQTYKNIELIIIDDGSNDKSILKIKEMLVPCKERFTRFEFRCRPNKGLSYTLNEAIEWSRGKYFAALASDDIVVSEKTSIQVEYMEKHPYIAGLFGSADLINEKNEKKSNVKLLEKEYIFDKILLNECPFYAPTQMLRLEVVKKVGGYDPTILVEDWYMWLKLAQEGQIYCLSEVLALYRIHSTNTTRNSNFIFENNLKTLQYYKDHKLYNKAYAKLKWSYIIWTLQKNKWEALKIFRELIQEFPSEIFTKNFLRFCKYSFFKIKNWN